ncbi:MAG: 4a-hydroxytetrahydrobiopterin dehydratase [Panacagrimonas sp.]
MNSLTEKRCLPCEGGVPALDSAACNNLVKQLKPHWTLLRENQAIEARFEFKNYYQTTAFVNALSYIAHREDHHPDVRFGYKDCTVEYTTHAVNGLTENDFICAAKIDALLD